MDSKELLEEAKKLFKEANPNLEINKKNQNLNRIYVHKKYYNGFHGNYDPIMESIDYDFEAKTVTYMIEHYGDVEDKNAGYKTRTIESEISFEDLYFEEEIDSISGLAQFIQDEYKDEFHIEKEFNSSYIEVTIGEKTYKFNNSNCEDETYDEITEPLYELLDLIKCPVKLKDTILLNKPFKNKIFIDYKREEK